MPTLRSQQGFTIVELMMATSITLIVLAVATGTFNNALLLNNTAMLIADSNQSLRSDANVLVRDLMQAGRGIPLGGIPIPSGAGATPLVRPPPPLLPPVALTFDNIAQTTLTAIITGDQLGPLVNGRLTDIVTMLALDPTSYVAFPAGSFKPMSLNIPTLAPPPLPPPPLPAGIALPVPALADDGASLTVGQFSTWLIDPLNPGSVIQAGDLLLFTNSHGSAVQTVTSVSATTVFFAAGDPFNFNQRGAAQGSILQIRDAAVPPAAAVFPQTDVVRIQMLTYYLDDVTVPGSPRLVRQLNFAADPSLAPRFAPQALAGVVDDLTITYDLVDGTANTSTVPSLPALIGVKLFGAGQIRKANLRVAVRSESKSSVQNDYLRNTVNTVVSLRSLAYTQKSGRYK